MTIKEVDNFYLCDKKEYDIENNKEFISWLNNKINKGYYCSMTTDNIKEMIDFLVNWYETKYPNRYFDNQNGIYDKTVKDNKSLCDNMDFNALLYRLSSQALYLIKNNYPRYLIIPILDASKYYMPYIPLFIVPETGIITNKQELAECGINVNSCDNDNLTLEKLLMILKNGNYNLNSNELEQSLESRIFNRELLSKILEFVSIKLLYSKNTIPDYGYLRSKLFINEFNSHIKDINLDTNKIDILMNNDYQNMVFNKESSNLDRKTKFLVKRKSHNKFNNR